MSQAQTDAVCRCEPYLREAVLTFDGGGIRGYASLLIVQQLLRHIRTAEGELGEEPGKVSKPTSGEDDLPLPCDYFNFMFGTSTGGIISIMLGRLRMSIQQSIDVYERFGTQIFAKKRPFFFPGRNKYDCSELERIVNEVAKRHSPNNDGSDPQLWDPLLISEQNRLQNKRSGDQPAPCRVGVLAIQENPDNHEYEKLHLFRSYFNPTPFANTGNLTQLHLNLDAQRGSSIRKIARATSAAPTYFRSVKIDGLKYIDAGIDVNNPSDVAWAEVGSMHQNHPLGGCPHGASTDGIRFLVSIGTGLQAPRRITSGGLSILKIRSIFKRAIKAMTDPEPIHRYLLKAAVGGEDSRVYYRFNVDRGLEKMKLDDCQIVNGGGNHTFATIDTAVTRYVNRPAVEKRLIQLAKDLVQHRRRRRAHVPASGDQPPNIPPPSGDTVELSASSPSMEPSSSAHELQS
ncbi:FabD/lysophospholipase-like protein, partial [Aureobasidium melanogenum]|uniref:FabD/lysophospholipase-like protein n=1 Tax=Aureobasidium melanogenum (strain CBS 110374) TaxID=1043003 RepID=A0A074VR80_AURM1